MPTRFTPEKTPAAIDIQRLHELHQQLVTSTAAYKRDQSPTHLAAIASAQSDVISILIGIAESTAPREKSAWAALTTTLKAAADAIKAMINNLR